MKIPDVGFPQGTHPTTYEFYGWARNIINEGRYEMRILNSAPTWTANDGEVVLVQTATERALYAYVSDGWYNLNWDTSGAVRGVPTGTVLIWSGGDTTSTVPPGYALCNGAAASRTTYATLFGIIGTSYGAGDGATTFNLPDLRGRFPLGQDDMGGSSANRVVAAAADTLGGSGGEEDHTLTTTEMPSHNHNRTYGPGGGTTYPNYGSGGPPSNYPTDYAGGGGAHNNMSPYITLNYIIKL